MEKDIKDKSRADKVTLTGGDLRLLSQIVYQNQWNGDQWNKIITPLINKLATMIDELEKLRVD